MRKKMLAQKLRWIVYFSACCCFWGWGWQADITEPLLNVNQTPVTNHLNRCYDVGRNSHTRSCSLQISVTALTCAVVSQLALGWAQSARRFRVRRTGLKHLWVFGHRWNICERIHQIWTSSGSAPNCSLSQIQALWTFKRKKEIHALFSGKWMRCRKMQRLTMSEKEIKHSRICLLIWIHSKM